MPAFKITLRQTVPDSALHKPHYDRGIAGEYPIEAESEDAALDAFHASVPIACLDDFEVDCEPEAAPRRPTRSRLTAPLTARPV
jgi:hypothetical protein